MILKKENLIFIVFLLNVFIICILAFQFFPMTKIAYADTSRLMVGFSEANKVERELKAEDGKWREQLKVLQDSVQAAVDQMSKEFDGAKPARKRELQDNLSAWNQRLNNFKHANMQKMERLRNEKMQGVVDKVNVYLDEYGKKHNYSIIFGTVMGGSILYGNKDKYDITQEIINGLNERYK
jgi:outer membrane protein